MFRRALPIVLAVATTSLAMVASSDASTAAPAWTVRSIARPTNFAPGTTYLESKEEADYYTVVVTNDGGAASHGSPVTVTDTLPAALTPGGEATIRSNSFLHGSQLGECTAAGQTVTCTTFEGLAISPGKTLLVTIPVDVALVPPPTVANVVGVTGGGASAASATEQTTLSARPEPFGLQDSEVVASNEDGSLDTQAGSHPFALTTSFDFNTKLSSDGFLTATGDLKNVELALPPGLVGNTTVIAQCAQSALGETETEASCPESTHIGVATIFYAPIGTGHPAQETVPVDNLVPRPGAPAELGFNDSGLIVRLTPRVRTDDYGLTVSSTDTSQAVRVYGATITIWGVPYAQSHDAMRGTRCIEEVEVESICRVAEAPKAFLTMPTSCDRAPAYKLRLDTWQEPNRFITEDLTTRDTQGDELRSDGCNEPEFRPAATIVPETTTADTPTGLTAEVKLSQEGLDSGEGLGTADLKNTTVTLPQGVVINPGQASGLAACQDSEDGLTSQSEEEEGKEDEGLPSCPPASKVGTAEITTPLLRDRLEGSVYVLQSNPPDLKLLVAASAAGVNVKLLGEVHLNEATGQLTTTFDGTPQLPFTDFKLTFNGGARAALLTPATCGAYASNADFTPYTTPLEDDVFSSSSFYIDTGPGGSGGAGCAGTLVFRPVLTAGSTTDRAGAFTSFSLLLQRDDDTQRIATLQFTTPAGLSGMLRNVSLCGEPQAAEGRCAPSSQIGHTVVESGSGANPLVVPEAGRPEAPIYLTAGYKGGSYGLSIVVPVLVGPFDLGTVVVRGAVAVDPHTAQLTITTDRLPSILDGVPTNLKTISAVIGRPEFMFNPTNCDPQAVSGTATSVEGASAPVTSRFQVGSCRELEFAPKFTAVTSRHTSKADGASLTARIAYPAATQGTQADIAKVKVDLPKQLPSRLTTLQKACRASVFEADPTKCPADSVVGQAIVTTPVLPVPLEGRAYFVSHGGEAFPSLTLVLQGYGVTIDLVGNTRIHNGVTSTTFNSVPDVPFETFELSLPEGRNSALAASGNLCQSPLLMPTAFVAQDGAEIHEAIPIDVQGCPAGLAVVSHATKRGTLKLSVYVPTQGRLTVSGAGLARTTKASQGREVLKLSVRTVASGRFTTKLRLSFSPKTGRRLVKRVKVKAIGIR